MSRRTEVMRPLHNYFERPPGFVFHERRKRLSLGAGDLELFCDRVPVTKLAEQYGTPLYVYSATAIRERLAAFDKAFRDVPHTICYSVKANSNISCAICNQACHFFACACKHHEGDARKRVSKCGDKRSQVDPCKMR